MFAIYQRIFGLKFERVEPLINGLAICSFYTVADAQTGEPLGLFYLDMFRATANITTSRIGSLRQVAADGKYQRRLRV